MKQTLHTIPGKESLADPQATVLRFFRAIDDREPALLPTLLAPDGVWVRQGIELRGETDVLTAMAKRSPTLRVHHILTNLYAVPCGDGEVAVSAYMLVVLHDSGSEPPNPTPLAGIDSIRTMRARLRQTEQGWRIVHLASDPPTFVK